ncbi:hypothetical protein ACTL6U_19925 [Rhodovibrionaceae bacterium A322]
MKRSVFTLSLLIVTFLAACGNKHVHERNEQHLVAHEGLFIDRPSLSPDGRYMVFDFVDGTYDRRRGFVGSGSMLALYDLQQRSIQILAPKPPIQWHSASFDTTGQKLTFIVACWKGKAKCPPGKYRTQIGVLNLSNGKLELATNSNNSVKFWPSIMYGDEYAELRTYKPNNHVVRDNPIFSKDGEKLYYVISTPHPSVRELGRRTYPHSTLMAVDVPNSKTPSSPEEHVLLHPNQGPSIFRGGGGPLSIAGNKLLFKTNKVSEGKNSNDFNKQQVTAYFLDLETRVVEPAIDFALQNKGLSKSGSFVHISTPMATSDGSKILLIRGNPTYLSVLKNNSLEDIIYAPEAGDYRFKESAVSGNGEWAIVFPEIKVNSENKDGFWLVNLKTNERTRLPLRSLLRQTLESRVFYKN